METRIYAGFWRRLIAFVIDVIVCLVPSYIIGFLYGFIAGLLMYPSENQHQLDTVETVVGIVIPQFVLWLYFTILESSVWQATLGKRIMSVCVTDVNGARISFGKANVRYWSKILSGLTLMIGYIMAGFTHRKQALHDKVAKTLVLKRPI